MVDFERPGSQEGKGILEKALPHAKLIASKVSPDLQVEIAGERLRFEFPKLWNPAADNGWSHYLPADADEKYFVGGAFEKSVKSAYESWKKMFYERGIPVHKDESEASRA